MVSTLEYISYTLNIVLLFLVIFFTYLNPSLLDNQYWVYVLVTLLTAIVFHSGHIAGKANNEK